MPKEKFNQFLQKFVSKKQLSRNVHAKFNVPNRDGSSWLG
jgi:radical SAM superfamily enzyme